MWSELLWAGLRGQRIPEVYQQNQLGERAAVYSVLFHLKNLLLQRIIMLCCHFLLRLALKENRLILDLGLVQPNYSTAIQFQPPLPEAATMTAHLVFTEITNECVCSNILLLCSLAVLHRRACPVNPNKCNYSLECRQLK